MSITTFFTFSILLSLTLANPQTILKQPKNVTVKTLHQQNYTTRAISPELAVNCKKLRLPKTLCSTCPLKPFDTEGNFAQRQDAFELSSPACQKVLKRYVTLNPCDKVRAKQIANQDDKTEARALEIFMYAVCETCCDCIPIGSRISEYTQRKKLNTLLTPLRGNCVMHYLFDTCKIFPFLSDVSRPNKKFLGVKTPVCDKLQEWRSKGFGRDWQLDPKVDQLPNSVKKYLARMIRFMGCRKKSIWQSCIPMERARGRI